VDDDDDDIVDDDDIEDLDEPDLLAGDAADDVDDDDDDPVAALAAQLPDLAPAARDGDADDEDGLLADVADVLGGEGGLGGLGVLDAAVAAADPSSAAPAAAAAAASSSPGVVLAEPATRANSFVGTEEYLAPEVIRGSGHGPPVDWWALGILIYELVFGFTPFRASKRDATFDAILTRPLAFPPRPPSSPELQDLVASLLERDEADRLGTAGGAEAVKAHPWFADVDWALLRNAAPPVVPSSAAGGNGKPGAVAGF
jgi:serine/threonine protein kinase